MTLGWPQALVLALALLPEAALAAGPKVWVAPEDGGEELRALLAEELPEALSEAVAPAGGFIPPITGQDGLSEAVAPAGGFIPPITGSSEAVALSVRLRELEGRTELIIQQGGALRLRRFIGAARSLAALRVAVVLVRQTLAGIALLEAPRAETATTTASARSSTATRAPTRAGLDIVDETEPEPSLEVEAKAPPVVPEPSVHLYRLILGAAAAWWKAPALAPNLGLTLGFERRGELWWLGGELSFAGIPCCVRTVGLIEATAVEVSVLGVAALPVARVGLVTFALFGAAGVDIVAVDATVLLPDTTRRPIETIPSAAASFRLAASAELAMDPTVRISVGARLGLPSLQVTAPPGLVSEPLDTGWVTPYVALGFPAEVF